MSQSSPQADRRADGAGRQKDTWVKPYFDKYRKQLNQAIALGVLTFAFAAMLMFTSGYLISRCAERPDGGIFVVLFPVAFVQIFGIGKPILHYIERLVSHDWVFRMTSDLRLRLYTALEQQSNFARREKQIGDVLALVAEDIGHLQNLYLRTIFPTVIGWSLFLGVVLFYGVFDWRMALAMALVLAIVAFGLPALSLLRNRNRIEYEKVCKNELYADLADNVIGSTDWVISGRSDQYLETALHADEDMHAAKAALERYYRVNDLVSIAVFAIGAVGVFAWSANHFGGSGLPRADWIAAFVLGFFPLAEALMPLATAATQVNVYRDSTKRLNDYPTVSDTDLVVDGETLDSVSAVRFAIDDLMRQSEGGVTQNTAKERAGAPLDADAPPLERAEPDSAHKAPIGIQVRNLSFSYDERHPVFRDVSLDFAPGEKVAILGRSGSGKSTLASLIRGEVSPTQGEVLVDGAPACEIGQDMHTMVGVVQQAPYLFNRTLRENLQIGREDASDQELWGVLETVGLGAMARRLPEGLDTMVDEAGMRFSGGERHRIALARVLLSRAPAILLDEPTVGLDPVTEGALINTLFDISRDKTLVMITHHLRSIESFDRVVFIEDGRIAMDGSPSHLQQTSERYRSLREFDLGLRVQDA